MRTMARRDGELSDLEFTQQECNTLHGKWMSDADAVATRSDRISEERTAGECQFVNDRHRLIGEMFHLLYSDNVDRDPDQPKALVIKVPRDSATSVDETFDVLRNAAATTWGTTGFWQGMQEDTEVFEVLFYDSGAGDVGRRLVKVAEKLGEKYSPEVGPDAGSRPGEFVLLATIEDIERTSITPTETESSFPSDEAAFNLGRAPVLPDLTEMGPPDPTDPAILSALETIGGGD